MPFYSYAYAHQLTLWRLPYLIRFRQCIAEYNSTKDSEARRRHFYNALKYSTSLPVLYFSYETLSQPSPVITLFLYNLPDYINWNLFYRLVSFAVQSTSSLYWDIYVDWELELLSLRPRKIVPSLFYYLAIIANTLLRYCWIMRFIGGSQAIRLTLEIQRRVLWMFFRIEREWCLLKYASVEDLSVSEVSNI